MKKIFFIVVLIIIAPSTIKAQDFTKYVSYSMFETYAKSIKLEDYTFIFAEQKGKAETNSINYSAMLGGEKSSIIIKMINIEEFSKGKEKLADTNSGVYSKYEYNMIYWRLTKAKESFLWVEMPKIKATFIFGMQPNINKEAIEETMKNSGCLEYFDK